MWLPKLPPEKIEVFFSKHEFKNARPYPYFVEENGLYPEQWATADTGYGTLINLLGQGYFRCLNNLTATKPDGVESAELLHNIVRRICLFCFENFDEIITQIRLKDFQILKYIQQKENEKYGEKYGLPACILSFNSTNNLVETASKAELGGSLCSVGYKINDGGVLMYNPSFFASQAVPQLMSYLIVIDKLLNRLNNPLAFALFLFHMAIADINIDKFGYDSISKMANSIRMTSLVVKHKLNGNDLDPKDKLESFIKEHLDKYLLFAIAIPEWKQ
jgi:hypothetical protein